MKTEPDPGRRRPSIVNFKTAVSSMLLLPALIIRPATVAEDRIMFNSGTSTVGTVIEYRNGNIRAIDEEGRERTVPISAIRSIEFSRSPEKLRTRASEEAANRDDGSGPVPQPTGADVYHLETLLQHEEPMLQLRPQQLITGSRRNLFSWTSTYRTSARHARNRHHPPMQFLGLPVYECIIHYSDHEFERIDVSLYNRGDAGPLEQEAFDSSVRLAYSALSRWCGSASRPAAETSTRLAGSTIQFTAWQRPPFTVVLESSSSGRGRNFQAEYIKAVLHRNQDPRLLLTELSRPPNPARVARSEGPGDVAENVIRDADGNVYISPIPMVDQGEKGYCTVATAARVLAYYNVPFDQHALAQVAETRTGGGTNLKIMLDQFQNYCARLRIRVRELYDNQALSTTRDAERFLSRYNRLARREQKPQLQLESYIRNRVLYVAEMYYDMDLNLLRRTRVEAEHRDYARFTRDVKQYVDQGIPLLWSVRLGLVPEREINPQTRGNHTRLIVGYNEERDLIIFSDSWGAGHERKTMPQDDAWTITSNLIVLLPMQP